MIATLASPTALRAVAKAPKLSTLPDAHRRHTHHHADSGGGNDGGEDVYTSTEELILAPHLRVAKACPIYEAAYWQRKLRTLQVQLDYNKMDLERPQVEVFLPFYARSRLLRLLRRLLLAIAIRLGVG